MIWSEKFFYVKMLQRQLLRNKKESYTALLVSLKVGKSAKNAQR